MRGLEAVTDAVLGEMQRIAEATPLGPEMRRVMNVVIGYGARGLSAKALALRLGLPETSLNSRFARIGAPSPRRLLVDARLVLVAELRYEGYRGLEIAEWCGFSSPQALGRHVRQERGMTPVALGLYPRAELDRFRATLTLAHWPECPITGTRRERVAA